MTLNMEMEYRGWSLVSLHMPAIEAGWWAQYKPADYDERPRLVIGKGETPQLALDHALVLIDEREGEE